MGLRQDATEGRLAMSRPWMPLYVGDYLRDTQHLCAEEHGAYLLLIMHYWTHGSLPPDEKNLQKISQLSPYKWEKYLQNLSALFGPNWTHKRIDQELEKAHKIKQKRELAGAIGGAVSASRFQAKGVANARKREKQMLVYHNNNINNKAPTTYTDAPIISTSLAKSLTTKARH